MKGKSSCGIVGNQSSIFVAPTIEAIQPRGPYLPLTCQPTFKSDPMRSFRKVSPTESEKKYKFITVDINVTNKIVSQMIIGEVAVR